MMRKLWHSLQVVTVLVKHMVQLHLITLIKNPKRPDLNRRVLDGTTVLVQVKDRTLLPAVLKLPGQQRPHNGATTISKTCLALNGNSAKVRVAPTNGWRKMPMIS